MKSHHLIDTLLLNTLIRAFTKRGGLSQATRLVFRTLMLLKARGVVSPKRAVAVAVRRLMPCAGLRSVKHAGQIRQVPVALSVRQRQSLAVRWLQNHTSTLGVKGHANASVRLALEVLNILSGDSATLTKRNRLHRNAVAQR